VNELISKELLSLVLDKEVRDKYLEVKIEDNSLKYSVKIGFVKYINLDTLGRLCKEWIIEQGYDYEISTDKNSTNIELFKDLMSETIFLSYTTELKAIVVATEWVAKEKGLL